MYEYTARCVYVVDGDTFDFDVDLGFRIAHNIRVRLAGPDSDTPELRSKNAAERKHAQEAKLFCQQALLMGWTQSDNDDGSLEPPPEGTVVPPLVRIRTFKDKTGKYGRYLAEVWLLSRDVDSEGLPYVTTSLSAMLKQADLLKRDSYPENEGE
jgi:micrococcal nuclease